MKRLFLWTVLCFVGLSVHAQECTLRLKGRVVDIHDSSPLAEALIVVAGSERDELTGPDGSFELDSLCPGRLQLQISHPYCATRLFTVEISANLERVFRLEHHLEVLQEVEVVEKSINQPSETARVDQIATAELERYSSGSLGDALSSLSGVSALRTGNTIVKPQIHGLHSSRVLVFTDGVRMADQEWGAEHAPNLDVNTASTLKVVKGAAGLQYAGDAVGGLVLAEAPPIALKDSAYGRVISGLQTNGRGGSITAAFTKTAVSGWFGSVQGTWKRMGDLEAPDYVLSNTGMQEGSAAIRFGKHSFDWGWEASYSYFQTDLGILRASHLGGASDQFRAIGSDRPLIVRDFTYDILAPRQDVTHQLGQAKAFLRGMRGWRWDLQYSYQQNQRFEFDIRRGEDADEASVDLRLRTHTLNLNLRTPTSWRTQVKTGMEGRFQENFANPATGIRRLIPDYEQIRIGAYAILSGGGNDSWGWEAGARYDFQYMDALKFYRTSFWEQRGYQEDFGDQILEDFGNQLLVQAIFRNHLGSASAGLYRQLGEKFRWSTNVSLSTRTPNPSEWFSEGLHHSAARIELGDLRFVPERSLQGVVNLEKEGTYFAFTLSPFYQRIQDFMQIEPTGIEQTIRGNFQVWEYRQTDAYLLGFDWDASGAITDRMDWIHQFSLVKGYDSLQDIPLILMPPARSLTTFSYRLLPRKNWTVSLINEYVFRQNEFPDTNFSAFVPETQQEELIDVSTPPEQYELWHLRSEWDLSKDNGLGWQLSLAVQNIFDSEYRDYLNRLRFYAAEPGRNIQLQIKFTF